MVLVDTREGSINLLRFMNRDRCEPATLDFNIDGELKACGDVMLVGNGPNSTLMVGVELKSLGDALNSISTGRLGGTQIPRMLKVYDVVFLLTFGVYRIGPSNFLEVRRGDKWKRFLVGRNSVPWSYFEGFLLTAQLQASLISKPLFHKHVASIDEAAAWLEVLDRWFSKPWSKHKALAVFDRSRTLSAPPGISSVEAQIAQTAASLPALDWVRGHEAAKVFNSIEEMMDAGEEEWRKVKGIGKVIAREVTRTIKRRK